MNKKKQEGVVLWFIIAFIAIGLILASIGEYENYQLVSKMARNDMLFCQAFNGLAEHSNYNVRLPCKDFRHTP